MATIGEVYAALPAFRAELHQQRLASAGALPARTTFRGAFAAMATPLSNVHATGVGIRVRGGKIKDDDFVIKVYVFDKVNLAGATPPLTKGFGKVGVDVEHLPVQLAFEKPARKRVARRAAVAPPNRKKHRPIVGGVSIAPLSETYVGTLGCFVRRRIAAGAEQIFALSNNHVLADTNRLPVGARIIQPGQEVVAGERR